MMQNINNERITDEVYVNGDFVDFPDTRFIFKTNFSGDPARDPNGSTVRKCALIIQDPYVAQKLINTGVYVGMTKPAPGREFDFTPEYFANVTIKVDSKRPPKIFKVIPGVGKMEVPIEELNHLDDLRFSRVRCLASVWHNERRDTYSLYCQVMYVEQSIDYDPYAHLYTEN